VPLSRVVVRATTLEQPKRRIFKRKTPLTLKVSSGEFVGKSESEQVVLHDMPAGEHTLIIELGECAERYRGCWPNGSCPEGCTSQEVHLRIGWNDPDVMVPTSLPLPD
jgi:hypothetical protein